MPHDETELNEVVTSLFKSGQKIARWRNTIEESGHFCSSVPGANQAYQAVCREENKKKRYILPDKIDSTTSNVSRYRVVDCWIEKSGIRSHPVCFLTITENGVMQKKIDEDGRMKKTLSEQELQEFLKQPPQHIEEDGFFVSFRSQVVAT